MLLEITKYIVENNVKIIDAMHVINLNKMRFSIVLKEENVIGLVTDGDIRRLLLSGKDLNDRLTLNKNFIYIDYKSTFEDVCNNFMENNVDFLPILKQGKLFNIITKKQFHYMMLNGVDYKADIDFSTFNIIEDSEIHNRPWGYYKSVWINLYSQAKIITIFPDSEISLQKHFHREEHWVIVKGKGAVVCGDEKYHISPGKYIYIPKECKHRIINSSQKNNLVFSEVQLGSYFGEDDIIRYSDKYGRK